MESSGPQLFVVSSSATSLSCIVAGRFSLDGSVRALASKSSALKRLVVLGLSVLLKGAIYTINLSFKPGNLLLRAGAGLKQHPAQKKSCNAWRKAKQTL